MASSQESKKTNGIKIVLTCISIGVAIFAVLVSVSFAFPLYQTTPYNGYHINYYFDHVSYIPAITENIPFSDCSSTTYNSECSNLSKISKSMLFVILSALSLTVLLFIFILKNMLSTKPQKITKNHLFISLLCILSAYTLITFAMHKFMKSFPFTKYCSYNGDDTGCKWFSGIQILMVSTSILCILFSIIIGFLFPFCKFFRLLPCFYANDDIDNDFDDAFKQHRIESVDDDILSVNSDHHNDRLLYITFNASSKRQSIVPIICSIFTICIVLVLMNAVLILSYFNEWYPSNYQAQSYINTQWNNAKCIDESVPIKYDEYNENECSFGYPDTKGTYNDTFWSCCDMDTCSKAFDYTSLMIGYNESDVDSESYKCWIDMQAMTKASCHPNGEYFVDQNFNISVVPSEKRAKLAVCALFCKQTYDHCAEMLWFDEMNNRSYNVKELWPRYDVFCEEGLGVEMRFEAFTDKCFGGCARHRLHGLGLFVVFVILIQ